MIAKNDEPTGENVTSITLRKLEWSGDSPTWVSWHEGEGPKYEDPLVKSFPESVLFDTRPWILVAGASGRIGLRILWALHLACKHSAIGVVGAEGKAVKQLLGSTALLEALGWPSSPVVIVNAIGHTDTKSMPDDGTTPQHSRANVEMPGALLTAAMRSPWTRLIHLSTDWIDHISPRPCEVTGPSQISLSPPGLGTYARSKWTAECALLHIAGGFATQNPRVRIIRTGGVWDGYFLPPIPPSVPEDRRQPFGLIGRSIAQWVRDPAKRLYGVRDRYGDNTYAGGLAYEIASIAVRDAVQSVIGDGSCSGVAVTRFVDPPVDVHDRSHYGTLRKIGQELDKIVGGTGDPDGRLYRVDPVEALSPRAVTLDIHSEPGPARLPLPGFSSYSAQFRYATIASTVASIRCVEEI